jgi:hypothetical protein
MNLAVPQARFDIFGTVGKNLLESVLLVLERAAYKSGLPPSLPPYRNLGSDALFSCDICLYIPVDSTLLHSSVALECKLSSSSTLQIPTGTFVMKQSLQELAALGADMLDVVNG